MKKSTLTAAAVTLLVLGSVSCADAQTRENRAERNDNRAAASASIRIDSRTTANNGSSTSSVTIQKKVNGDATTTTQVTTQNNGRRSSTTMIDENGRRTSTTSNQVTYSTTTTRGGQRSEVAIFVQNLLNSADRLGGIGSQVRVIAREQASSTERMDQARAKIEARSRLASIFAGSDYENIGVLRRELGETRNRLARLNRELDKVASSTVKAEIQSQIALVEQDQDKIEAFIREHEDTFSLFGWFRKVFVRSE